jgi:hypothetical protein
MKDVRPRACLWEERTRRGEGGSTFRRREENKGEVWPESFAQGRAAGGGPERQKGNKVPWRGCSKCSRPDRGKGSNHSDRNPEKCFSRPVGRFSSDTGRTCT